MENGGGLMDYSLLDSGNGRKLEQFGKWILDRPCAQAIWQTQTNKKADARFVREDGNTWEYNKKPPESWNIIVAGITFKISLTDFGHLGIFPEQLDTWFWLQKIIKKPVEILNLFAYSGGSTLAAAKAGAKVCHVDASKGMVQWARENAALNGLEKAPIRWIVDDVIKFLRREVKRGKKYDGIIMDPPTFGRGNRGEIFKIERDLPEILYLSKKILSEKPLFIALSCHTAGYSPQVLHNILEQKFKGDITSGEMIIPGKIPLPSGTYAWWQK